MTKKELSQLKALMKEKEDLEQRIRDRKFTPTEEVVDVVKDYRTGTGKAIVIRGYGDSDWQKLRDEWYAKLVNINHKIRQMERFLDSVEDAEMREILRLRYQDGMTQEQVGKVLGYSRPAIQKKEERFWNSITMSQNTVL